MQKICGDYVSSVLCLPVFEWTTEAAWQRSRVRFIAGWCNMQSSPENLIKCMPKPDEADEPLSKLSKRVMAQLCYGFYKYWANLKSLSQIFLSGLDVSSKINQKVAD